MNLIQLGALISLTFAVNIWAGDFEKCVGGKNVSVPVLDFDRSVDGFIPMHMPRQFNQWTGDPSEIVNKKLGIKPKTGKKMLQCHYSTQRENYATQYDGCQVFYLVDLLPYKDLLQSGSLTATFSIWANRVKGNDRTDRTANIQLVTTDSSDASAVDWNDLHSSTSGHDKMVTIDDNPETWEKFSASMKVTPDTNILILNPDYREYTYNNKMPGEVEFDGHFFDRPTLKLRWCP